MTDLSSHRSEVNSRFDHPQCGSEAADTFKKFRQVLLFLTGEVVIFAVSAAARLLSSSDIKMLAAEILIDLIALWPLPEKERMKSVPWLLRTSLHDIRSFTLLARFDQDVSLFLFQLRLVCKNKAAKRIAPRLHNFKKHQVSSGLVGTS